MLYPAPTAVVVFVVWEDQPIQQWYSGMFPRLGRGLRDWHVCVLPNSDEDAEDVFLASIAAASGREFVPVLCQANRS